MTQLEVLEDSTAARPLSGSARSCAADCCSVAPAPVEGPYRRILWVALLVNFLMFGVELVAGAAAHSVSIHADALDFLGDSANYAVSLFVLASAVQVRARASLLKAASMGAFGFWVLGRAAWQGWTGVVPEPITMGAVGAIALAANLLVGVLLYRFREGDSNMRSVWLCTRNDALGNIAVGAAALGVFSTRAGWPDAIVAGVMGTLALTSCVQIVRHAVGELRSGRAT